MYQKIIEKLADNGYDAEYRTINKNGIDYDSIVVKMTDTIGANFYPDEMAGDADKIADDIMEIMKKENNNRNVGSINNMISNASNWDYVKDNLFTGIRAKTSQENIIKKDFLDMEVYMYVTVEGGRIVLQNGLANTLNKSVDELFEQAVKNSKNTYTSFNMGDMIAGAESVGMIILTNNKMTYGASAITDTDFLDSVCDKVGNDNLIILPSSVHEVIVVSGDSIDPNACMTMVKEINATQVAPVDRLTDNVYKYNRNEKKVVSIK